MKDRLTDLGENDAVVFIYGSGELKLLTVTKRLTKHIVVSGMKFRLDGSPVSKWVKCRVAVPSQKVDGMTYLDRIRKDNEKLKTERTAMLAYLDEINFEAIAVDKLRRIIEVIGEVE